jgi:hypothetical protein
MKINEILNEGGTGSLTQAVARTMPTTWNLPGLKGQDPYYQYRMGVAMANARSGHSMDTASAFGENMTIVAYTAADDETVKSALKQMGPAYAKGAKSIASKKSEESKDVGVQSPVAANKKNRYGV